MFKCHSTQLYAALARVVHVVGKGAPVYLQSSLEGCFIHGFKGDIKIKVPFEAMDINELWVQLDPKKLLVIAKNTSSLLTFSLSEDRSTIEVESSCGHTIKFECLGFEARRLRFEGTMKVIISARTLIEGIVDCEASLKSLGMGRKDLHQIQMVNLDDGHVCFMATNGHLATSSSFNGPLIEGSIFVPSAERKSLLKFLIAEHRVEIYENDDELYFRQKGECLVLKKSDGVFPPGLQELVFEQPGPFFSVSVGAQELKSSLRMAKKFALKKTLRAELVFGEGSMILRTEPGDAYAHKIKVDYEGEVLGEKVAFNVSYLKNLLPETGRVKLQFSGDLETSPIVVKFENKRHILMPLKHERH